LQIDKLPPLKLRAVGQVGVFGKRVMLPAAGIVNDAAPPHAGGAVEVEEHVAAGAAGVFQNEVAVQKDGFDFRKERVIPVDVGPAGLHHADLRVSEVMNRLQQKIRRRNEVRVEH